MLLTSLQELIGAGHWISPPCLHFMMIHILFADPASAKKKKEKLRDQTVWSLCVSLEDQATFSRTDAALRYPGHSKPSIFINHSLLLLCPPHKHQRTLQKNTHHGPFLPRCSGIAGVFTWLCTRENDSAETKSKVSFCRCGAWNNLSCGVCTANMTVRRWKKRSDRCLKEVIRTRLYIYLIKKRSHHNN